MGVVQERGLQFVLRIIFCFVTFVVTLHSHFSVPFRICSFPPTAGPAVRVSFVRLYNAISMELPSEWAILLLYNLLVTNSRFREFVYSKSDIEVLVLPLLQQLYSEEHLVSNRPIYVIIILLLVLTQDASFCETAHRRLTVKYVSWYRESYLADISLGSLIMAILLRTMQRNLSKERDPYLHTNCLAALANLAPSCTGIHPVPAQRIVDLLTKLSSRYLRLFNKVDSSHVYGGQSGHHPEIDIGVDETVCSFDPYSFCLCSVLSACVLFFGHITLWLSFSFLTSHL